MILKRLIPIFVVPFLTSCVLLSDDGESSEYPEPWSAQVLTGSQHVGTKSIPNWPPPFGECVEGEFALEDLPIDEQTGATASRVSLLFNHAGNRDGLIEINGTTVFSRVTWADKAANAIADVLVGVTMCTIESLFPEDPECDPITVDVETTLVHRVVSTEDLSIGVNTYRMCATQGDFLVAGGIKLKEMPSSDDVEDNGSDADSDSDF